MPFQFSNTPPDSAAIAGVNFYDGPDWDVNDLAGQTLEQYDAEGGLIGTYTIVSNTALAGGVLTIDVGEDWNPFEGSTDEGIYWVVQDPVTEEDILLRDTGLGSAGVPYEASFERIGVLTTARANAFAMTAIAPGSVTISGVDMVNADPTSRTFSGDQMTNDPPDGIEW